MTNAIVVTKPERMELTRRMISRSGRADDARRARLILLLEEGLTRPDLGSDSGEAVLQ